MSNKETDADEQKAAEWKEWIDEMGKQFGPKVKIEYERFPGYKEKNSIAGKTLEENDKEATIEADKEETETEIDKEAEKEADKEETEKETDKEA